jgi:glycine betaine/choline ABC-type transport system substrate-binding protein
VRQRWSVRWLLLALAAMLLGGLAGCGSTGLLSRGADSPVTRKSAATTTSTTTATPRTASTTTTAASLTTMVTTTINGTATTVDEPGVGHPTILLGDMNTPEQFIVGALYQSALESQGYSVELSRNIGATSVSEAAIAQGSLDIFPEYLNVYDSQIAGLAERFSSRAAALRAGRRWAHAHGQGLLNPTPFSDTAGIAVLRTKARAHHLRTLADLRRIQSTLTLGSPVEFSAQSGGLPELERAYDFYPAVTSVINIGDQYGALRMGTLGAAYVQTTDWELSGPTYQVLADSRHVLGFGNIVPVVSKAVLAEEGPDFAATINRIDALLNMTTIRGLAAEMRASTDPAMSASEVAKEFLEGYGILPPPPWSTLTATLTTPTRSSTPTATQVGP